MAARLNHTIVWCHDQEKSATFLTEILGLPPPRRFMGFLVVDLANEVSVDYLPAESEPIALQHLAFLVSEDEFDGALARVRERTKRDLGRSGQATARPHQPSLRRPRRLFRRPQRAPLRDHHHALRRSR